MTAQDAMQKLREQAPDNMQIPPPCFTDMQGEMIAFDADAALLRVRFPVLARYQNPMGFMQGGFLVAMMDNTIGPLSFLVAPPSVTTQLNTSYLRPVTPDTAFVVVTARLTQRTRTQLFLSGEARNEADKVLAISHATHQIMDT